MNEKDRKRVRRKNAVERARGNLINKKRGRERERECVCVCVEIVCVCVDERERV